MSDGDNNEENPCSGVPRIEEVPEFKSAIPPEVYDKLDARHRALFDAMSKMERHVEWQTRHVVPHNRAIHRLCREVERLKLKETVWTAKYGWILWIGTTVVGAIVLKVCTELFDRIWP